MHNDRWWLENGYSALLAAQRVEEDFLLVAMVDHVVHPAIHRAVAYTLTAMGADVVVGGDRYAVYVDHGEATRIRCDERNRIVAIGKGLNPYDYVDVGVIGFRRSSLTASMLEDGETATVNSLVQKLASSGVGPVVDVTGLPWKDVDTVDDLYDLLVGPGREVLDIVRSEVELPWAAGLQ